MSTLTFVIPAYNEGKTISGLIKKVVKLKLPGKYKKEIIVVNDYSKDNTADVINKFAEKNKEIKLLNNKKNLGKSQTVKKGVLASSGDYVVIQDADLEYDPEDIVFMFDFLLKNKLDVIYGNRFGRDNGMGYTKNFYGNLLLSFFSNLFTIGRINVDIPDMEVCYKLVRGDVFRKVAKTIESKSNFGFEPEITAKLSKYKLKSKNLQFGVLPIKYFPRTYEEGKKMKAFRDGFKALVEIIRFNLFK